VSKSYFSQILAKTSSRVILLINFGLFIAIVATAFAIFILFDYFKSEGPLTAPQTVIITDGMSVRAISEKLGESGVIRSPELFTFIMRGSESEKKMKAGEYLFPAHVAPVQVYRKIVEGDVVVRRITVPEGLMVSQVLEIVGKAEMLTGDMPTNIKEGELLPETYDYRYGESKAKVVERMRESLKRVLAEEWEKRDPDLPYATPEEALTMASIVEKETGVESERARVAAVFVNRLRKKMRLQTDPTVIYALTGGLYVMERPLYSNDLQVDSPYNTYRNEGLPPGPIANPGRAAIHAALHPMQTEEIYFVADGTGGHKFATTLKEHNENVQNWRKINENKQ
jgi:UPF0755 protein